MGQGSPGVIGRLEQRVAEVDRLETTLTHGHENSAIPDIKCLQTFHVTKPACRGTLRDIICAPHEPALENRSAARVDDCGAVTTPGGIE